MPVPGPLLEAVEAKWTIKASIDYAGFVRWLDEFVIASGIPQEELPDLLKRFSDPSPRRMPDWQDPDGGAILRELTDAGPLASLRNHGWIDEKVAVSIRLSDQELQLRVLGDLDAARDIQENALHILGRCNKPKDWGPENRRGLVYGMVQSGKTANMLALMTLAQRTGYRLFILLAGDKSSLRDQTQFRVNSSFGLIGGYNVPSLTNSPTWRKDYLDSSNDYTGNFQFNERVAKGEEWTTIVVIKKQTDNLKALINDINLLGEALKREGRDLQEMYPCLLIDDEADYGTPNTDTRGAGSEIHNLIVELRNAIPHNTYVGYTATPQACLSADPSDVVGYPKDFFWLLEPYQELINGEYVPRSYLGAYELFWEYTGALIHEIGRDEWPHHERDERGRSQGIYAPRNRGETPNEEPKRLVQEEARLLEDLDRRRRVFPSLSNALADFVLGCAVRWWQSWIRSGNATVPSVREISTNERFRHHAAMIHLSVGQENQERIRRFVQREWTELIRTFRTESSRTSPGTGVIGQRWNGLTARIAAFHPDAILPRWEDISPFVDLAIDINEEPIRNSREPGFPFYEGSPFIYKLNATDDGMELLYDPGRPLEIRTKKAAIIVGGNILSRGLTIEGLCVTVFGRTARMPLGDATLQMGRWLGHKRRELDLISIFLQKGVQDLYQQVALADRYLRLQIKDVIKRDYSPMQVLLELRNSPFFRATSPAKSRFLSRDDTKLGFAGRTTWLEEPSFLIDDIQENGRLIRQFASRDGVGKEALDRATLYRDADSSLVIELLESLICPSEAGPTSFAQYATYLADWRKGGDGIPPLPKINVAIWNSLQERQRVLDDVYPFSEEEARNSATPRFESFIGGRGTLKGEGRSYRGDAFLDKEVDWHRSHESPSSVRTRGDDILIVLYQLHPRYLTKSLFEGTKERPVRAKNSPSVYSRQGDSYYVAKPPLRDEDLALWTFAAWTPTGGPLYRIGFNVLIDPAKVKMVGRTPVTEPTADENQ